MKLTRSEEQLMGLIWEHETLFMKDLIDLSPEPKPAVTTLATLLKRMQDKGFVGYKLFGNSRQYYPLVKKTDYFSGHVKGMVRDFFSNSSLQFASFFTTSTDFSTEELEDLKKIIDTEIKKKQK